MIDKENHHAKHQDKQKATEKNALVIFLEHLISRFFSKKNSQIQSLLFLAFSLVVNMKHLQLHHPNRRPCLQKRKRKQFL